MSVLKSTLREVIEEVLEEYEIEDGELEETLLDRLGTAIEVMDDDDVDDGTVG